MNTDKFQLSTLSHETFYHEFERDLFITAPEVQKAILGYLDANPETKLVCMDNLASLTHIREDKSDDWRESVLSFLIACRRRGVAVLMIHHAGKNGDQRGTGAREDALDAVIKLSKAEDGQPDGAHFKLEFTKARGVFGEAIEPFIAKLKNSGSDDNPVFSWEISSAETNTEQRLLKLIRDVGTDGITVGEAARELQVNHSTISRAKHRLSTDGLIEPGKIMRLKGVSQSEVEDITENMKKRNG